MDEARIDDERLERAVVARDVQLRPLVAAFVDLDEDPAVRQEQPVTGSCEVGQLLELAAGDGSS